MATCSRRDYDMYRMQLKYEHQKAYYALKLTQRLLPRLALHDEEQRDATRFFNRAQYSPPVPQLLTPQQTQLEMARAQYEQHLAAEQFLDAYQRSRLANVAASVLAGLTEQQTLTNKVLGGAVAGEVTFHAQPVTQYRSLPGRVAQGLARPHHCSRPAGPHPGYSRREQLVSSKLDQE